MELLSCPFCGNEASKSIDPEMMFNHGCYMVECTYCHGRNLETDWNDRASQWISVKDKENQPIINEIILITDCFEVYTGFLGSDLEYYMDGGESCEQTDFDISHWMSFPQPPEEPKA